MRARHGRAHTGRARTGRARTGRPAWVRRILLGLLAAVTGLIAGAAPATAVGTQAQTSAALAPATTSPAPTFGPPTLTPTPTPAPTRPTVPSPSPLAVPPLPAPGGDGDDPSWWDVPGQIAKAIDKFLAKLVGAALNPVLDLVGRSVLSTPDLTTQPRVVDLWTGSLLAANTCLVLFVLAGAVLVMTHETVQTRYAVKDIAPRLVVGVVAANTSLVLVGKAIEFTNALTQAVVGPGVDPASAGQTLRKVVVASILGSKTYLVLIALGVTVLAIALAVTFVVRICATVLLLAAAPLALTCHTLPGTDGLARLWWRCTAAVFAIQLAQGLTLAAAMRVFLSGDGPNLFGYPSANALVNLCVCAALLWILLRIPVWAFRVAFGGGQRSTLVRIVRSILIYKALGAAGILGGHRRGGGPAPGGPQGGGPASGGGAGAPGTPRSPGGPARRSPSTRSLGAGRGRQLQLPLGLPAGPRSAHQLQLPLGVTRNPRTLAAGSGNGTTPRGAGAGPGPAGGYPSGRVTGQLPLPLGLRSRPRPRQLALPYPAASTTPASRAAAVPHPATARRTAQLRLPGTTGAGGPPRPVQQRLPVGVPRAPRALGPAASAGGASAAPPATSARGGSPPAPRPRQPHPARPVQLRLPLDVPRPPRPSHPTQLRLPLEVPKPVRPPAAARPRRQPPPQPPRQPRRQR